MQKNHELLNARIENHIKKLITSGKVKKGQRLPSFRNIAKGFNASVIPVVQAAQKLAESGMVERIPGKGTFVKNTTDRAKTTNRIAVLYCHSDAGFFSSSFYMAIVSGIETAAQAEKKTLLFKSFYRGNDANPVTVLYELVDEVDGFLIVDMQPGIFAKVEKALRRMQKPVVVIRYEGVPDEIDSVVSDSRENTRKMIRFLIDLGHRRIACLYNGPGFGQPDQSPSYVKRIESYREILRQHGLPVDESLIRGFVFNNNIISQTAEYSFCMPPSYSPAVLGSFKECLNRIAPPTAFFCVSDEVALNIYMIARALKMRIPDDLTVVGYDNLKEMQFVSPGLTTLGVPLAEMGSMGLTRLMQIQNAGPDAVKVPCRISLPGKILIRESHRALV